MLHRKKTGDRGAHNFEEIIQTRNGGLQKKLIKLTEKMNNVVTERPREAIIPDSGATSKES